MDYYQNIRSEMIRKVMYPVDHRKDYIPKREDASKVKIEPKDPCIPSFVSPIEGKAVEEGARIFFEGIVDAQPHPTFEWYFEDELIVPGEPGWEEVEIHHSRKMSTLIIRYTREYHMGRFTMLAENELGYETSTCDLIVRKKQFPPVFWKRLVNNIVNGGQRYIMEVEVGGWPIPDVYWYKDDEMIIPRIISENYNSNFNAYVPERKIELIQIDQIRHAIIISRLTESDSGKYTVYAKNALGEAVCEADIEVDDEGLCFAHDEMYLPDLWRSAKRLTWKDEDNRAKKFVGFEEPELTDEDIRDMTKRVASTPLPRSLEYLASLPDYRPDTNTLKKVLPMNFKPDPKKKSRGQSGERSFVNVRKPSKFNPGTIHHRGYKCDQGEKVYPVWRSSVIKNQPKKEYNYRRIKYPSFPKREEKQFPKEIRDPPCPHVWESHDQIDALYKILGEMRERDSSDSHVPPYSRKKLERKKSSTERYDQVDSFKVEKRETKKVHFHDSVKSDVAKQWSNILDENVPGSQSDADKFTKEFIKELSGSVVPGQSKPQIQKAEKKIGTHSNYLSQATFQNPPMIIKNSELNHSKRNDGIRSHYAPTPFESTDESSSNSAQTVIDRTSVQTVHDRTSPATVIDRKKLSSKMSEFKSEMSQIVQDHLAQQQHTNTFHEYVPLRDKVKMLDDRKTSSYESLSKYDAANLKDSREFIPVREKVKMITQQNEEIVKREEQMKDYDSEAYVPGGVRILTQSPLTVRKELPQSPLTLRKELPPSPLTVRKELLESPLTVRKELPQSPLTVCKEMSSQVQSETHVQQETVSQTFSKSKILTSSQVQTIKRLSSHNDEDSSFAQDESTLDISRASYAGTETSEAQYSDTSKESMIISHDEESPVAPLAKSKSFVHSGYKAMDAPHGYSASAPSTPQNTRRSRTRTTSEFVDQSNDDNTCYRQPTITPFQPSFYRLPPKEDSAYSGSQKPLFRQIKRFTKRRPKYTGKCSDSEN
ncbi:uncharacterized protein [Lepeophtheirus salmonis]|uniref:uncharacterized protein n=1 Tax=Lepeophtheirus salmonis TaxID=72036 RepID=UPI001AE6BA62|nr:muscle M-line assembly protein unc-89-like [Lepeophtheirus salmonis]